ncbi:beta-glucuronidase-like isoform X2 [Schistocerca americana]|nr:beta-glucuronidase-like isoform X2 [Schistocerca americana]
MDMRQWAVRFLLGLAAWAAWAAPAVGGGLLFPRDSESRELRSLDGVWSFRLDPGTQGYDDAWYSADLSQTGAVVQMPVPASYNDVTQEAALRDHVGLAWYDRRFFAPAAWRESGRRVWLRFGSVHYFAQVWLNGYSVMTHEIGHLPFQADVTSYLIYGESNRITVAVNNTLSSTTIPQGSLEQMQTGNGNITYLTFTFDFFNYAGIHRSVVLYTTPEVYIDDITITTDYSADGTGAVNYTVVTGGQLTVTPQCEVELLDANGSVVATGTGFSGELTVINANAWWPYLMNTNPGYLYTLKVNVTSVDLGTEDVYRLPVGIRRLRWDNTSLLINDKPVYLRGFGRHEDSDVFGRGLNLPMVSRDHSLLKWVGANAYRTSHYPYAEETMDFADQQGIMIIDESPGLNIENYSPELLENHKRSLTQLITRDKNRPSVIIWSVSNEPRTQLDGTEDYYRELIDHVKSLDATRPTTIAMTSTYDVDRAGQFLDIIGVNRYNAWYYDSGFTGVIVPKLLEEMENWREKYNKPIIMTEYGADSMVGLHMQPEYLWSEEYQVVLMSEHFKAFDTLRERGYFIGELIWNFADFQTGQYLAFMRAGGNRKGAFTRSRQPKAAAHHLRGRYWRLAQQLDGAQPPEDVDPYLAAAAPRDEL